MDAVLGPFLQVVLIVIDLYIWIIIIGVILSWLVTFNVLNTHNRFVYLVGDVVYRLTEPLQGRIRRLLPHLGGLDISPLVLVLMLIFFRGVITNFYYKLG